MSRAPANFIFSLGRQYFGKTSFELPELIVRDLIPIKHQPKDVEVDVGVGVDVIASSVILQYKYTT